MKEDSADSAPVIFTTPDSRTCGRAGKHEVRVDKTKYSIRIPRERETEDEVVIVLEPKE